MYRKIRNSKIMSNKSIATIILMTILVFSIASCHREETTPEPPSNAEILFNCDVTEGFADRASPAEIDAIREDINNAENQIKELQDLIITRQNKLTSMESTNKSETLQSIENKIASLENEIKSLREQIVSLQNDIKTIQSAEKTQEVKTLEDEINNMKEQIGSLQNDLRVFKNNLSDAINTPESIFGYVEYLKIDDTELYSDLSVEEPISSSQRDVVAVLSSIFWEGNYADPIQLSCLISKKNRDEVDSLISSVSKYSEVEFIISVYEYDEEAKCYYKCFHTNSIKLKGLVDNNMGQLAIEIDMEQPSQVTESESFFFVLGVIPQKINQEVHIAVGCSDKFVKQWGTSISP